MTDRTVGVVGVGLMGHGIAHNVQKGGWRLVLLEHPGNQPLDTLRENGAELRPTARDVAAESDIVILCVTGAPQVEEVALGETGVLAGLRPGATVIDCSTSVPSTTVAVGERITAAGGRFLDAPMTRTPKEAAEGRLNLIVGGERATFEDCLPLLESYAETITHAGEIGSGHAVKLLHNYVSLGFSAVLAETMAASNAAGIAPEVLHEVLSSGAAKGVVYDRLAPYLLEGDPSGFRFSLANGAKDTQYYADMDARLGTADEIAQAVRDTYSRRVAAGEGEAHIPELVSLLAAKGGGTA